ncbi:MAG: hypothetical protein HN509_01315 [Halobacteriovoraceae bacterium]|jgi:hypothetical protein|nr:hypothetical protein [Halobacteriovoraceae bacterium]MBT5095632.1 hypothetical protein [Halobacteriovoraceae bacterium]
MLAKIWISFSLITLFASIAVAENYKTPKLQWKPKTPKAKVKVKKETLDSNFSYKVEEEGAAVRNVASDKKNTKKVKRDPSSKKGQKVNKIRYWKYVPASDPELQD